jgi:hypothetical protein
LTALSQLPGLQNVKSRAYHRDGSSSIPGQVMWDVVDEIELGQFSAGTSAPPASSSHSIKMIHTHLSSRCDKTDQSEADVPSHPNPRNLLFIHNIELEHGYEEYIKRDVKMNGRGTFLWY